ncbi:hypothetical protein O988_09495, partial [Pseudogymnoascus sp. VKM F-3808]
TNSSTPGAAEQLAAKHALAQLESNKVHTGFRGLRPLNSKRAKALSKGVAGATNPRKKKSNTKGRNLKQAPNDMRVAKPQASANLVAPTTKGKLSTKNDTKGHNPKQPPNNIRAAKPQPSANLVA